MRRLWSRWVVTLNLLMIVLSIGFFLYVAAITSFWVSGRLEIFSLRAYGRLFPGSARARADAMGADATGARLYAQPLADIGHHPGRDGAIALRSLARLGHGWHTSGPDKSWLNTAGIAGSLALGAVMLGYYVTYLAGVRWRLSRHAKT